VVAIVDVVGIRKSLAAIIAGGEKNKSQAAGILYRARAQNKCVESSKNGCVYANAESQSEDGDAGEAGTLAKDAEGIPNVCEKAFEGMPLPDCAAVVFDEGQIAELAAGGSAGFFPGHAGGHEFFDLFFEVFADFGGEIVVETVAGEELF
jgi:hypothetical protein